MTKKSSLILAGCMTTLVCFGQQQSQLPNIVVILADDLGWGDVGCNGAKQVETPNIDALARDGVNFKNGYAPASTSTPTRYALMTGEFAFRRNLRVLPGDGAMTIPSDNLASFLKSAGYKTTIVGKWHLGLGNGTIDWNGHIAPSPNDIGFDYSFIIPATGDRVPCVYVENGSVVNHNVKSGDLPIEVSYKQKVGNDPTGAENPQMERLKSIAQNHSMTIVNGISRIGWVSGGYRARWVDEVTADLLTTTAVRTIEASKDKPFFLYFAPHDAHEPRVINARFAGRSNCGIYGDVITQFDNSVAEVVKALKSAGVYDNTIIILSSDNGPMVKEAYDDGALENLNGHDPYAGLRGTKYTIYEGGHRVPFIVSWPSRINGDRTEQRAVSLVNIKPTIASLIGHTIEVQNRKDAQDDSGIYLNTSRGYNTLYLQQGDGQVLAVRDAEWKYIEYNNGRKELYNLDTDHSESKNVITQHPKIAAKLKQKLTDFRNAGK